jgi:hypothetical protein
MVHLHEATSHADTPSWRCGGPNANPAVAAGLARADWSRQPSGMKTVNPLCSWVC